MAIATIITTSKTPRQDNGFPKVANQTRKNMRSSVRID